MIQPKAVIANVWRALNPVATIVAAIESALSSRGMTVANPVFFPRPEEYRGLLEAIGFAVNTIGSFPARLHYQEI